MTRQSKTKKSSSKKLTKVPVKSISKSSKILIGTGIASSLAALSGLALKKYYDSKTNKESNSSEVSKENDCKELEEYKELSKKLTKELDEYKQKIAKEIESNKKLVIQINACNKEVIRQRGILRTKPSLRENILLRETLKKYKK